MASQERLTMLKRLVLLTTLLFAFVLCSAGLTPSAGASVISVNEGGGNGYFACTSAYAGWHLYFSGEWHTCGFRIYGWTWIPGYF